MPYIKSGARDTLDPIIKEIQTVSPGTLNYAITKLCLQTLPYIGNDYNGLNAIIGVLESVKLEFYRRMIVWHETKKIDENGDVYP